MSDMVERVARASEEVERLSRELDITNADHIALWLEGNTIQDEPMSQCVSWLACRIVEAHERAIAAIQADAAPVATSDRQDAIEAAQDVLAGRGNGTYDEALDAIRWLLQSAGIPDAAPVAWMPIETAPKDGTFILLHEILAQPPVSVGCYDHECGWLIAEADFMPSKCIPHHWMPLPAAPVDDRVSTSSPVDVGETGNTSSKLRPASVVAHEVCEEMEEYGPSFATKVIEADRQAVRAALVAKIVAWLRTDPDAAYKPADAIEAGEWK